MDITKMSTDRLEEILDGIYVDIEAILSKDAMSSIHKMVEIENELYSRQEEL